MYLYSIKLTYETLVLGTSRVKQIRFCSKHIVLFSSGTPVSYRIVADILCWHASPDTWFLTLLYKLLFVSASPSLVEMESSRRHCFCVSLVYLSALLVSVAMIVVGALYAAPITSPSEESGCRAEPMIPWYLIFGGCLTAALVLGRIIVYKVRPFHI